MKHHELRQKFLEFFRSKGHAVIPSAPVVPLNDPTVLFTTAGMHPLVPYLLGEPHPAGTRLVDVQKCIRTGDIDEVGDDTHLTFFEMLGNWSLGDYFKTEAITWSFEFLTDAKWLGIPRERLAVSCFAGDENAPRDTESAELWQSLGMPASRIAYLPRENNWWGPAGVTGPCGPDTEMFYWIDNTTPAPEAFDPTDPRWVEIWNDVFMQYRKNEDGGYEKLAKPNVDTGMGLERTLAVLNGQTSVYDTELFVPLITELKNQSTKSGPERSLRIIADHLRAAAFMICDGVEPTNKDRGYVLRRLLRRSMIFARPFEMKSGWYKEFTKTLQDVFDNVYSELKKNQNIIDETIRKELEKFDITMEKGIHEFHMLFNKNQKITGKDAFDLYQSFGIPWEVTKEMYERFLEAIPTRPLGVVTTRPHPNLDPAEFEAEFTKHKDLSRTASAGTFKGGLADHSEIVVRYHTATHLLHQALRTVLGEHVIQRGSNITAERTRFDFSHDHKLTPEQIAEVERLVNDWITRDLPMTRAMMSQTEARELGALGAFGEKYGDTVSVYTVSDPATGAVISREFCGGPHVEHTGQIGHFKITKEEAVSAGVRRIKAVIT